MPSETKGMSQPPRKSTAMRQLNTNIAVYSPRKNMANFMPEYSVW